MRYVSRSFSALKHRNFRLFWFGQLISLLGTWMQTMAQGWLVLQLTDSPFLLGLVNAMQFLPMLLFSLFAGVLVDRVPKRRLLILTQTAMMLLALVMGILTLTGIVRYFHVFILATLLGIVNTFDMPGRQAFVVEMVGKKDLMNAIALNSSVFNAARIIGPALAGLSIGKLGIAACFLLNGVSFIPVILGFFLMTIKEGPWSSLGKGEMKENISEGLHYIGSHPIIRETLLEIAFLSIFAMNFTVLIPVFSRNTLELSAEGYGFLMTAFGGGALTAGLLLATRNTLGPVKRVLIMGGMGMCLFQIFLSFSTTLFSSVLILMFVGFCTVIFTTSGNSTLQMNVPDHLRGRVMSAYSLAFAGVTPIGSFLSGSIANWWGAPTALSFGALMGIILFTMVLFWDRRKKNRFLQKG